MAPSTRELELELRAEFLKAGQEAKKYGLYGTRFLQMLAEHGPVRVAEQLVESKDPASGFTDLCLVGRLDLSVEAIVLRGRWCRLFSAYHLDCARKRLKEIDYVWIEHPDASAVDPGR